MTKSLTAQAIANHLLGETGESLLAGDFDRFAECSILPQEFETPVGRRQVQTLDELEATFDAFRNIYERDRVTHVVRHCVDAAFRDETTIASTHETRLVTADLVLHTRPYPAFSILKLSGGRWRVAFSRYEIQDAPELMFALTPQKPDSG